MAKKKLPEIRADVHAMDDEKLAAELRDQRNRRITLRTQSVTEKVEDNSQFSKARKMVARILTERRARQLKARG